MAAQIVLRIKDHGLYYDRRSMISRLCYDLAIRDPVSHVPLFSLIFIYTGLRRFIKLSLKRYPKKLINQLTVNRLNVSIFFFDYCK